MLSFFHKLDALVHNQKLLLIREETYSINFTNFCLASHPLTIAWILIAEVSRFFSRARSSLAAFVCSRNVSLVVKDLENISMFNILSTEKALFLYVTIKSCTYTLHIPDFYGTTSNMLKAEINGSGVITFEYYHVCDI